jgi:uncharacterized protein (DUF302 family)
LIIFNKLYFLAVCLFTLTACAAAPASSNASYVRYDTQGIYADVREDLSQAIINRGLVISGVSHIAEMLDRTGKDVGSEKKIYLHAEALQFCSAVISRRAMEADSHNAVFCPYTISVYELANEPGKIYVSYRKAPEVNSTASREAMAQVEKLLADIVSEALRLKK